jgi:outer membrane protein
MSRIPRSPLRLLLAAAAAVAAIPSAAHAQAPALNTGSLRIAGSASLSVEDADSGGPNDDGDNTTTFLLSPTVQYFVRPGLALGGTFQIRRASDGDITGTSYGIGPAATYYFVRGDDLHPFVTGSVRYGRSRVEGLAGADIESDELGFRAAAGILFLLSESVGIDAGLYFDRVRNESGPLATETNVTSFGLAVGVSAFVF